MLDEENTNSSDINNELLGLEDELAQGEKTKKKFTFHPVYFGYLLGAIILAYGGYTVIKTVLPEHEKKTTIQQQSQFDFELDSADHKDVRENSQAYSQKRQQEVADSAQIRRIEKDDQKLSQLSAQIKSLFKNQKVIVANQKGIKNLQLNEKDKLEKQIANLTKEVQAMHAVKSISSNLHRIQQQLDSLLAKQTSQVNPLSIVAVMPGKAWVKTKDNNTIFLTKDTKVKGYGHVVKIDADAGKVFMSSGFVIS
ncbi:GumC domain-containing protein [Facilibium subflavum]|uniref:hypothetical protein n=1 Tax=Facilibium subflavum TaxID=2219058 RepID=UPI000E658215|nr:hypothetical protein [Facilibium subflavum]